MIIKVVYKMNRRILPTSSFIKRYLKANKVSQRDLHLASGYSEKQISLIMHDKTPVTRKFAHALSECVPGLDEDYILNYSNKYQEQLKNDEKYLIKNNYKKNSKILRLNQAFKNITADPVEQTSILLETFNKDNLDEVVSTFGKKQKNVPCVVFSKDQSKVTDSDNVVVDIWTKIIVNQLSLFEENRKFVGVEKAKKIMEENKDLLSTTDSSELIQNISYICEQCGIHVAFCHAAPTSYIRGLSFSSNGQIYIVLTDRFKKIEYVVFAFVHEIMHILNGDIKTDGESIRVIDIEGERTTDILASNYLINENLFNSIIRNTNHEIEDLYRIARESNVSIGIVVSKYQHDTNDYQKFWQYLNTFTIQRDLFGN